MKYDSVHNGKFRSLWSRTVQSRVAHIFLKNITRIKFSIVLLNKMTRFKSIKSFDFIEGIVHFLLTKPYTQTIVVHLKLSLLFISSCNFSLSNFFFSQLTDTNKHKRHPGLEGKQKGQQAEQRHHIEERRYVWADDGVTVVVIYYCCRSCS